MVLQLKAVKVLDPLTGEEVPELRPFVTCAECGRELDNTLEGFYGHTAVPDLALCQGCYQKKAGTPDWEPTRVKVKKKWLPGMPRSFGMGIFPILDDCFAGICCFHNQHSGSIV